MGRSKSSLKGKFGGDNGFANFLADWLLDDDQFFISGGNVTVSVGPLARIPCELSVGVPIRGDLELHVIGDLRAPNDPLGSSSAVLQVRSPTHQALGDGVHLGSGTMFVRAAHAEVEVAGLVAGKVDVEVDQGVIIFDQLDADANITVGSSDTGDCFADDPRPACINRGGDVFVTVPAAALPFGAPVEVDATQPAGIICLAAIDVQELESSNTSCATVSPLSVNATETDAAATAAAAALASTLQCQKRALLYAVNGTATTNDAPAHTIIANVFGGGVYVSVEPTITIEISQYQTSDGGAFHGGVRLDRAATDALQRLQPWILSVR